MSYALIDPASERLVVDLTTPPTDGQILVYDSASDSWVPGDASGGGGGGGSDPWTTIALETDFTTSNTISLAEAITGWTFTPAANKVYLIEFHALANAASTATGIRPGYSSAMSGTINCGMYLNVPNGAGGTFIRNLFGTSTQNSNASASASATPHYIHAQGMIISGASPSGDFQLTLASEIGGSDVTFAAGSIFRYREVS